MKAGIARIVRGSFLEKPQQRRIWHDSSEAYKQYDSTEHAKKHIKERLFRMRQSTCFPLQSWLEIHLQISVSGVVYISNLQTVPEDRTLEELFSSIPDLGTYGACFPFG